MIDYAKLGEAVLKKRDNERLSLQELGDKLGISKGHLSRVERGEINDIGGNHLVSLLMYLGAKIEDFVTDKPSTLKTRAIMHGIGNCFYHLQLNNGRISFLCEAVSSPHDLYHIASLTISDLEELQDFLTNGIQLAKGDEP